MRRSIAASRDIREGEILAREMLTTLRPASGIAPHRLNEILGKRINRDLKSGEILLEKDLL